ncbi:unnamed protein product [Cuscuta campestris]|uniref:WAT1-related protein n=1 Tax=Cuscuta campestris TaxID=132261 RepID=A0A484NIZ2_9ASTE|nr:unnamed protein product [Cuscuta campestris]
MGKGSSSSRRAIGAMVIIQMSCTGMTLLSKSAMSRGFKPSIFVAYRQAFASLTLAPFALYFERQNPTPLSLKMLCKISVVSLCGVNLSLNLFYAGLSYVSATFVTAVTNTIPALVFLFALSLRLERVAISKSDGKAKVAGCTLSLIGAMVLTLYKGPLLYPLTTSTPTTTKGGIMGGQNRSSNIISAAPAPPAGTTTTSSSKEEDWIRGSLLILAANVTWSLWLIMQGPMMKQYPAKLRLVTLQCCICCVMSTAWGAFVEREDLSSWKLGWDLNLLSVAYCGIGVTGISYWLQAWVVEKKGPVFASMFTPLALLLTAFFSALFFKDTLYSGCVLGAALLVIGLYGFLWGKKREEKDQNNAVNKSNDPPPKQELDDNVRPASIGPELEKPQTRCCAI